MTATVSIILHIAVLASIAITLAASTSFDPLATTDKSRRFRQKINLVSTIYAAPERDSSSYDSINFSHDVDQIIPHVQNTDRRYVSSTGSYSVQPELNSKQAQANSKQFPDQQTKDSAFFKGSDSGTHMHAASSEEDWSDEEEPRSLSNSLNLQTVFHTEKKPPRGLPKFVTLFRRAVPLKQQVFEGFPVPLTLQTIDTLLHRLIKEKVINHDTIEDIWKRVKHAYESNSFLAKTEVEAKLIILEQIEKVILQYFGAFARMDKGENFIVPRYSNQYLMAAKYIDSFITENDMFGKFDTYYTKTTDESKISCIHYYLFCQYASKIRSRDTPLPPHVEAMYLNVVASETRQFDINVYTSKESIKDSADDFFLFRTTFQMYLQLCNISSQNKIPNINMGYEVCQAWFKRELEIKTDAISVDWKTLDHVQKTFQAIEDVYLQQDVKTRKHHYSASIIEEMNIYSINAPFSEHTLLDSNEFNMYVDSQLLRRCQTYPIDLSLWTKLIDTRRTILSHGILMREMDLSNANFLVDHVTIHVLFEHAKQELQISTEISYSDEDIAILNDILKVCDREFNYLEQFGIETTSCHDMLNKTIANVIEMTTQTYEIMNDIESIAHEADLGCITRFISHVRIISFFVRKLSLLPEQESNQNISFPIKKHVVQEAFTLLSTFKHIDTDNYCLKKLMSLML